MGAGEYIRNKRLERRMSQRQLSSLCGISNSEISRIEAGERQNPSPAVLQAIAAALSVPYEDILLAAGYLRPSAKASRSSDRDSSTLPEWVYSLPPDLYDFVREDASKGWAYLRMAKGFSKKDLDPGELEALVRTWVQAKKGYEKPGRKD